MKSKTNPELGASPVVDERRFALTKFSKTRNDGSLKLRSWPELRNLFRSPPTYRSKDACALIRLGTYENDSRAVGSKLLSLDALQADYDGNVMPVAAAAARLRDAGITSVIYTSANNGVVGEKNPLGGPRWRIVAPVSGPIDEARHQPLMDLLNGALGGVLGSESWDWARCYYAGKVDGAPYEFAEIEGDYIDTVALFTDIEPIAPSQRPKATREATAAVSLPDAEQFAAWLLDNWTCGDTRDGEIDVECVNHANHSAGGAQWAGYHPDRGFHCFHAGCSAIDVHAFRRRTGYEDVVNTAAFSEVARTPEQEAEDAIVRARNAAREAAAAKRDPVALDWSTLEAAAAETQFVIPGWMPDGVVTLFAAHGGTGKSFMSLYIALCLATGRNPFHQDESVEPRKVVVYSAEDNAQVMRSRLVRYMRLLGISPSELDGRLHVLDATESDNVLFTGDEKAHGRTTARFAWLAAEIEAFGASVLIFDNASDAMDANENDRAKVRQFMSSLKRLAPAVLLLAHVDAMSSMADIGAAKGYSGSTGWHNSARSRWFMARVKDSDEIVLTLPKVNYAKAGSEAVIRWSDAYKVFEVVSTRQGRPKAADSRVLLLDLFQQALAQGRTVSPAPTASTSVFNTIQHMPGFPPGLKSAGVRAEVGRWQAEGLAAIEDYTRDRKPAQRLVLTAAGRALCEGGADSPDFGGAHGAQG